jgi:hypothetical protein
MCGKVGWYEGEVAAGGVASWPGSASRVAAGLAAFWQGQLYS